MIERERIPDDEEKTFKKLFRDGLAMFYDKIIDHRLVFPFNDHYDTGTVVPLMLGEFFFRDCHFNHEIVITDIPENYNLTFKNCIFKENLRLENAIIKSNVRFRDCRFLGETDFHHTRFEKRADFWKSTFYQNTKFYKTEFLDIADFSAVCFKENVLFTHALIHKLLVLRNTNPEKGFDLSTAVLVGDLSIFNFKFDDYTTYTQIYKDLDNALTKEDTFSYDEAYTAIYETIIAESYQIPIENKRETYRIIKHQLENQKNYIDAIPYKVKESRTHFKESWLQIRYGVHLFNPISNIIVLSLNGLSNWFGSSYIQGILFTLSVGTIFFHWALSHIGNFEFTMDYTQWQWDYFVQFLNPTHRFDYMKAIDAHPRTWFFIWDFIGRIFVGYGIYQTIQAFRKYR
ncbi:pentapeptide repeat-containing protein [uncultured Dokdonia sp.]|uniref:pentapeptide repeat-containing protein n=1 Tax=uncultured Dokdonia sp. TaxID=575653 RepID=UPI00262BC811|nr:pentapeptide repeat-containing protein [uncultured Dokdonia sp.]